VPALLLSGTSSVESLPPVRVATSYALAGTAPQGSLSEGIYWEYRSTPHEYLRIDRRPQHDLVIFGGLDHAGFETSAAADRFVRLERRLTQEVPGVRVEHRWSGQIVEPADGRPYVGEVTAGVFAATGFGGNGMSFGTLAGMMAADAACGVKNPWAELLDPRRNTQVPSEPWARALAAS
jgi:glycine/D-amino acid oxidase-like deaminating enzyme